MIVGSIINWPTAIVVVVIAIVVAALASMVLHERKVWGLVRFGVFLERRGRLPNGDEDGSS